MRKLSATTVLASLSWALLPGAGHADTRLSVASGVDFSSGSYGQTEKTEVVSTPLSVRMTHDDWALRASIAHLRISGPADVADTIDGGGDAGGGSTSGDVVARTGTETGLGDLNLSATRSFRELGGAENVYLDVTARVRVPTADDDNGLGVGAYDYALNGELGASGSASGAYVLLGRRFLGDHDGRVRQDGWQAGLGGWLKAGERTRVGAFYSWREASVAGNEAPSEAGAYVSYSMNDNVRLSVNASGGLNDASPDYTIGLRLTLRTDRF
jgi:hypothetical protein